jgi:hypothetical protein
MELRDDRKESRKEEKRKEREMRGLKEGKGLGKEGDGGLSVLAEKSWVRACIRVEIKGLNLGMKDE